MIRMFSLAAALLLLPQLRAETVATSLGDFEEGTLESWAVNENTKHSVCDEHATSGKKSLRVELSAGSYPGIRRDFKAQDWSRHQALRFNVFNAGTEPVKLSVRVDDTESKAFASRFNLDGGFKLAHGNNELEIPLTALWQGSLLSRGLHLERISSLRFFVNGVKNPVTLFFDQICLVTETAAQDELFISAANDEKSATWTAVSGAKAEKLANGIKIELPAGKGYPGITFTGFAQNWLAYDHLILDIDCRTDLSPTTLTIKLADKRGHQQTLTTPLVAGQKNQLVMPLAVVGSVALGRLETLAVFVCDPAQAQSLVLEGIRLRRLKAVPGPCVHGRAVANEHLTLDFSPVKGVMKNTPMQALIAIPQKTGEQLIVHCSSEGLGVPVYSLSGESLANLDELQPVRIWGYFLDHGGWFWRLQEIRLKSSEKAAVTFESGKDFGH